jgi:hypothetical protein
MQIGTPFSFLWSMIKISETKDILTLQLERVYKPFTVWHRLTKKRLFLTVKKFTRLLRINSMQAKQISSKIMFKDVASLISYMSKTSLILNKLHRFISFSRKSLITNRKLTSFQSSIKKRNPSKLITYSSST